MNDLLAAHGITEGNILQFLAVYPLLLVNSAWLYGKGGT